MSINTWSEYVIRFADGTFFQHRGGYDWGRSETPTGATVFHTRHQAEVALSQIDYERNAQILDLINDELE